MACCTIPPSSQKRALEFNFPRSKRRKCGTMYTIPNHISTSLSSSSSPLESTIIIDANAKKLNNFKTNSNNLNIVEQKLKSEEIMENIRNEAKRLIKRKQLTITKPIITTSTAITTQKDIPLFSIEQVSQIVVKMMKEREEALHEQYQLKLTEKLSEQYSTFVKFTHEQIQKRFETSNFSYVS
jgi:hypothetical protein